ncbi:MAG TPA: FAD-binding oxidoreductase [Longimicrobium sp.]|jgi:FAD/FMN-containing dehydrogenase|uniref:FAD-binding oxidoreductase n=1 Tax=Longimicrobium sp. TaxID=2029185 RepID=UPI002ED8DA13
MTDRQQQSTDFPAPPAAFRGAFSVEQARRTAFSEHAGILRSVPSAVAVPVDADDVAEIVRWAAENGLALVPRAAGTGMPGGNIGPGVAVDLLTEFRRIGPVDAARRTVRVEPGATLAAVNAAAAPSGLHFPPDPSSGERAAFGGLIANNSAGAHTVRYGATRQWIESVDLVLADGSRATATRGTRPDAPRLREILARVDELLAAHRDTLERGWPRVRKNSSGYALREYLHSGDAVDLVVGSEGTLALVTAATVRLEPVKAHRGLALLEFTALEAAGAAVHRILELDPATCEMIDRTFIDLVRGSGEDPGYPLREGLEAILFVEMEGDSPEEVADALCAVERAMAGVADRVSLAVDQEQQERFWHVRHAASPLIARMAGQRVSMQFIEDGVVPVDRLADYIRLLRATLSRHGLPAVIFGHAGDGNLHVNPLVDVTRPGWREDAEAIVYEVAEGVAALGGTMAGEHGDGRLRAPVLRTIWGDEITDLFRAVKNTFDPAGMLNPGVILPLPGQRPLDAIKYAGVPKTEVRSAEF